MAVFFCYLFARSYELYVVLCVFGERDLVGLALLAQILASEKISLVGSI